ncbi:MAG TPA: hypothetical protein VGK54_00755, partial [Chloroflexota bacterium]
MVPWVPPALIQPVPLEAAPIPDGQEQTAPPSVAALLALLAQHHPEATAAGGPNEAGANGAGAPAKGSGSAPAATVPNGDPAGFTPLDWPNLAQL